VLLFAFNKSIAAGLNKQFEQRSVHKCYLAVARGYLPESGVINRPLREDAHSPYAEAITEFRCLETIELPIPLGKFPTVRYSLAAVYPLSGRKNQIRRHFAGFSHHLVGDVSYGDGRHNRLFREKFDCHRLLLHAYSLAFDHPSSGKRLQVMAPVPALFQRLCIAFGWALPIVLPPYTPICTK
jgi:tRNA pseudouridine65 synthase